MTGMFTWRYTLTGAAAAAQAAVRVFFDAHEFRIDERGADEWHVSHGSRPSFLAKMAGDYHEPVVLTVRFSPADTGDATEVELHRPVFAAAGGVSRDVRVMQYLDQAYRSTAAELRDALQAFGTLRDSSL